MGIADHGDLGRRPLIERIGPLEGWALTLYNGCDLRCTYCITGVQGRSEPRVPAAHVAEQLRRELPTIPADARITVGALNDAYPRAEATHGVTRAALAELIRHGRLSHIVTKGDAIVRDIDLLADYGRAKVIVSLCSHDDALLRTVDPKAPTVAERLAVVAALDEAGIDVEVAAAPWIPEITDAARLIELVPPHIVVRFSALRVADTHVVDTAWGRRYQQAEVNDAYVAAREAAPHRPGVHWSQPPAVDGAPPHISVLLGRRADAVAPGAAPPRRVLFFLHVMKTGGTTLKDRLRAHYRRSAVYPCREAEGEDLLEAYVDVPRLLALDAQRRDEVRLFTGHFPFAAVELMGLDPPPLTMTILREPVARTISHLRQLRRLWPPARGRSIEDLYDDPFLRTWFVDDFQTRLFAATPWEVSVLTEAGAAAVELPPPGGVEASVLDRAVANLESVDLVGVTEDIDGLARRVERRLDIRLPATAPANVDPGRPEPLDEAFLARVRADLTNDRVLYERACELAAER